MHNLEFIASLKLFIIIRNYICLTFIWKVTVNAQYNTIDKVITGGKAKNSKKSQKLPGSSEANYLSFRFCISSFFDLGISCSFFFNRVTQRVINDKQYMNQLRMIYSLFITLISLALTALQISLIGELVNNYKLWKHPINLLSGLHHAS